MTIVESNILFQSANLKLEEKEEIKILMNSKKLKAEEKREINILRNQIVKKRKELYKILKDNIENTNSLLDILGYHLALNNITKVQMILENHIFFMKFRPEFYDKLINLSIEEKENFILRLKTWIKRFNQSAILGIAEILEERIINDKINLK